MRRRLREQRGQVLPLFAAGMAVVVLGMTAFVVDVGHAYLVKRQLQAAVDSAALAGAQQLPQAATATDAASAWAGTENTVAGAGTPQVSTACLDSTPSCTAGAPNAISVTEQATVPTTFARVLGIDSMTVKAKATAARTASAKPRDIVLVLDRTHSMEYEMTALQNAALGFLDALDDQRDHVALVVLPPIPPGKGACSSFANPARGDFYPVGATYVADHLGADPPGTDFAQLRHDISCLKEGGSTAYKPALEAAETELESSYARPDAAKVIVFETDGAANMAPDSEYTSVVMSDPTVTGWPTQAALDSGDIAQPCGSAIRAAGVAKSAGTTIYTIHFDESADQDCYQAPHYYKDSWGRTRSVAYHTVHEVDANGRRVDGADALAQIASSEQDAFTQGDPNGLADTFKQVASALSSPRLVPDGSVDSGG